jgi:transcriptional regulator with XRE-family HTH domain
VNPPTAREIVAAEVRAALGRANVKQSELAARIGMSQAALSERLSARRPFSTDQVFAIADALGIDPLSLMQSPTAAGGAA